MSQGQGLINYMWEIWLHLATVKKNTHHLIDQYHSIRIYGLINLLSQMDGNYCLLYILDSHLKLSCKIEHHLS